MMPLKLMFSVKVNEVKVSLLPFVKLVAPLIIFKSDIYMVSYKFK